MHNVSKVYWHCTMLGNYIISKFIQQSSLYAEIWRLSENTHLKIENPKPKYSSIGPYKNMIYSCIDEQTTTG